MGEKDRTPWRSHEGNGCWWLVDIRRENKDWGLENRRKLVAACREIGRRLAKRGHTLVVGSDQAHSVDPHVVEGYLSEARRQAKVPPIQVIEGIDGKGELYAKARRSKKANVLFELGFFINALGKGRVRAVVQDGTEILADYGGHIYLRFPSPERVSDIEPALRKLLSEDVPPS